MSRNHNNNSSNNNNNDNDSKNTNNKNNDNNNLITESYDGGIEHVDDVDVTRKLEDGEVSWHLEGG